MDGKIELLIKCIRESFVGAEDAYLKGSCYQLFKILKSVYPEANAWISDSPLHVISEINGKYFDINGRLIESLESEDGDDDWQLYCIKTGEYYDVLPMINLEEMDCCKYDMYQHLSTFDFNYKKANEVNK